MVQINFALREVNCKIVYYGPGMSGKTTNLEIVHKKAPENNKGELTSIATEGDRTLFFDFMPLDLGNVAGMRTKFQLYTVPGQVYYNSTRKLVLQGADGVIFVADSSRSKMKENIESWNNLEENLREYGKNVVGYSQGAIAGLTALDWPGNVRQIENRVRRLVIMCGGDTVEVDQIDGLAPEGAGGETSRDDAEAVVLEDGAGRPRPLRELRDELMERFERRYVDRVLSFTGGNVSEAARVAKKDRRDFHRLMQKLGISAESYRGQDDGEEE